MYNAARSSAGGSRRSTSPQLGLYPTYNHDASQHPHPPSTPAAESEYEEHDITTLFTRPWSRPGTASPSPRRLMHGSGATYGTPHPYGGRMMSPAPSSAPAGFGYTPESLVPSNAYGSHQAYSEPAQQAEWNYYAGDFTGQYDIPYAPSRASYPVPGSFAHDNGPQFFGVRAPHHHPNRPTDPRGEVLPSFPQWSRTWYDGHLSANGHAYTAVQPPSGVSGWESESFTKSGGTPRYDQYPYGYRGGAEKDFIKEERIRMLEKQFGKPKVSHRGQADEDDATLDDDALDDDANLPIGSVDSRGKLVCERPRWRVTMTSLIALASIACFAVGIGGALLIKPGTDNVPAACGSIASYIVYACSIITLVVVLYLYVFRRCCCNPMRKEIKETGMGPDNPLANMIIPVLGAGAPKKSRGGFFGNSKKKRMMMAQQQQAPTVNLIVDPALLGIKGEGHRKGRKSGESDEEYDEDDERLPGDARRSKRRRNGIGVLGNMQMQRRWHLARKSLKLQTVWHAVLFVAWLATVIIALGFGKTCSASQGNGWCNYYHGAIACGAILVALLAAALFLDYRDLHLSKKAPKPPM